jgi:hypothetical protein
MDKESLVGFQSDYNVFFSESGSLKFSAGGAVKTFAEWQALGYDVHSVVVNPNFNNFTDFVPAVRLDYGTDLGEDFSEGLSTDAVWSTVSPKTTKQNGTWQAGARIYGATTSDTVRLPQGITNIYPNPAYGFFHVLLTDEDQAYTSLKVFDSNGRLVHSDHLGFDRVNTITLPWNITSGLYTVLLESNDLVPSKWKIVIIN